MAWTNVQAGIAGPTNGSAGATVSVTFTFTNNITTGNRIVVVVNGIDGEENSDPPAPTITVSDNAGGGAGNTYTQLGSITQRVTSGTFHGALTEAIYSAPITVGGGTKPTVTVSVSGAVSPDGNTVCVGIAEYSGLDSSSGTGCLDTTAGTGTTTFSASSANETVTTTGSCGAGGELILSAIGDFADNLTTWSISASSPTSTINTSMSSNANNNNDNVVSEGTSTNGATASVTWHPTNSETGAALILAIKLAASAPPPPPPNPDVAWLILHQHGLGSVFTTHPPIPPYAYAPNEVLGLVDSVARALFEPRSGSENLGLVNSTTAVGPRGRAISDNLGLPDSTTRVVGFSRSTANNLQLTDTASANVSDPRPTSETLGLVDSISTTTVLTSALNIPQPPVLFLLANLGLPFPTPVGVVVAANLSANLSENLGLTDSTVANVTVARSTSENLGLTDTITVLGPTLVPPPAPIPPTIVLAQYGITPAYLGQPRPPTNPNVVLASNANDSLGLTDTATANMVEARSTSENLGYADSVTTGVVNTPRASADNLGLTDSVLANLAAVRTVADLLGLIDGATRMLVLPRLFTEHLGFVDVTTGPAPPGATSRLSIDLDSGHLIYRLGTS